MYLIIAKYFKYLLKFAKKNMYVCKEITMITIFSLALRMLIGLISASPWHSVSQPLAGCPCKPLVLSFSARLRSSHSLSPLSTNLDAIYWPQKTTSPLTLTIPSSTPRQGYSVP